MSSFDIFHYCSFKNEIEREILAYILLHLIQKLQNSFQIIIPIIFYFYFSAFHSMFDVNLGG